MESGTLPSSLAELNVRQLLDNSESFSGRYREALQGFISHGKQEIETLEAEILPLRMQLLAADARLESLRDKLSAAVHVLAPINLLPNELLLKIFRHVGRECWLSSRSEASHIPALALLQVCRRWHSLAMSSPTLWEVVHLHTVPFRTGTIIAPLDPLRASIRRFVERSGSSLISVHFLLEQNRISTADLYLALEELISTSNRWRHIELIEELAPSGIDLNSDRFLPIHHNLAAMETLTIGYFPTASIIFEDAPRLRSLRIVNPMAEPDSVVNMHPAIIHLPWQQLTHLTCEGMLSRNILSFIRAAPSLEVLYIEDCVDSAYCNVQTQVKMPRLRSLSIMRRWSPLDSSAQPKEISGDLRLFFNTIIAENLEVLIIENVVNKGLEQDTPVEVTSFARFIATAACSLTVLSIFSLPIPQKDLLQSFKPLSRLKSLCLYCIGFNSELSNSTGWSAYEEVGNVIVDELHSGDDILLPSLQHLYLAYTSIQSGFSDKALVDMIAWRYGGSQSHRGPLRYVNIYLIRHIFSSDAVEALGRLKREGLGVSLTGASVV